MKCKDIFLCWDFIFSFTISVLASILFPFQINTCFAKDFYTIAITILSIVFSLFFAALALIITSNEDDFVDFLEEDNIYTDIVETFKFTLLVIFITLIYSIALYFISSYSIYKNIEAESSNIYQIKWFIITFLFCFLYSLFATFNAMLDAIKYANKRLEYIKIKNMHK